MLIRRLVGSEPETGPTVGVKNIVLLPLSATLNTDDFAEHLRRQLSTYGRTLVLNRQNINAFLGERRFVDFAARVDQYRLGRLLETLEFDYDYVIYQANHADDTWTRLCNW